MKICKKLCNVVFILRKLFPGESKGTFVHFHEHILYSFVLDPLFGEHELFISGDNFVLRSKLNEWECYLIEGFCYVFHDVFDKGGAEKLVQISVSFEFLVIHNNKSR